MEINCSFFLNLFGMYLNVCEYCYFVEDRVGGWFALV